MRLTEVAQTWLAETLEEGDIAIDATLGNGFDALFLAQQVGEEGYVYGFDVQQDALISSKQKLCDTLCHTQLFLAGHETMKQHIPTHHHGRIKTIMFNLGWLPNSDKNIITQPETTIKALEQSLELLTNNGRLSVMLYPGHHGGGNEANLVKQWSEKQNIQLNVIEVANKPSAPMLLQIQTYAK